MYIFLHLCIFSLHMTHKKVNDKDKVIMLFPQFPTAIKALTVVGHDTSHDGGEELGAQDQHQHRCAEPAVLVVPDLHGGGDPLQQHAQHGAAHGAQTMAADLLGQCPARLADQEGGHGCENE